MNYINAFDERIYEPEKHQPRPMRPHTVTKKYNDNKDIDKYSLEIIGDDKKLGTGIVVSLMYSRTKEYFGISN